MLIEGTTVLQCWSGHGDRFILGVGGKVLLHLLLVRPEASLVLVQVFHQRTACCQWFPGGQAQDLTGESM